MSNICPWDKYPLNELETKGIVSLGRGNVISKIDIQRNPGGYPIYSSSSTQEGLFGTYGDYMFDEEMITWSIDGGGHLFYRPRHKFSVTNVSGYMKLDVSVLDYRFVHAALAIQHSKFTFNYQTKAHPSVIRNLYHIPLPPLPEQKKIAEILSGIDRTLLAYEKQVHKLSTSFVILRNNLITSSISAQWVAVEDLCTAQAGGTPDRSRSEYYCGPIPWVKSGEVRGEDILQTEETITEEAITNSSARIVPAGSILVAMYGATAGQTAQLKIQAATNQAVLALNSRSSKINNRYIFFAISTFKDFLLTTCQGSGQSNLSAGLIKNLAIPVPNLEYQDKIVIMLDAVLRRIAYLRAKLSLTRSLKQAISSDLLSGRKRVTI